jgi:hypothetical protein
VLVGEVVVVEEEVLLMVMEHEGQVGQEEMDL